MVDSPGRDAILQQLERLLDLDDREATEWVNHTKGVLRGVFGSAHPLISEIEQISFYPVAYPASDASLVRAFQSGISGARGLLQGALQEYDLSKAATNSQEVSTTGGKLVPTPADSRGVFVVHGRNTRLRDDLFAFLRALGLIPMPWSSAVAATHSATPYIGDVLDAAFSTAQAIVVLMTPDDEAQLRARYRSSNEPPHETSLTPQPRPNVLFEAGMAMGRSADRTIIVEVGALRGFTDIVGRHTIRLENDSIRRQELAERLRVAGCPVTYDSTEWQTVGRLTLLDGE